MKSMLVVKNKIHCAFFEMNQAKEARAFRASDSRLKFAKIHSIIQGYPSKIEIGEIYHCGTFKGIPQAEKCDCK
jgi:hypothetical protein